MSQFSLEINTNGMWKPVNSMMIKPITDNDQLRISLFKPVAGTCIIRITNGKIMRKPIIAKTGETVVPLGLVRDYSSGVFKIYIGSGGLQSEEIAYDLHAPEKETHSIEPTPPDRDDIDPPSGGIAIDNEKNICDENLRKENAELRTQIEALLNECEDYKSEISKLQNYNEEISKLVEEKGGIERAIIGLREENEKAEAMRQELMSQSRQLGFDITDNQTSVKDRTEQLENIKTHLITVTGDLEEKKNKLNKYTEELEKADMLLQETQKKLEKLAKSGTDAKQSLQELIEKRKEMGLKDEEIAEIQERIGIAKRKIEELNKSHNSLEKEIDELEASERKKQEHLNKIITDINTLDEERGTKEGEVNQLQTALKKLNGEYKENMSQIKERLNTFYKECGLVEKQSKNIMESLKLVETAAEDDQFRTAVEDIDLLKQKIEQVSKELKSIMKEYQKTIRKLESAQM